MNKPMYLGMSILGISETLMYEVLYEYVKPKHQTKAKLCYMDTDSFVIYIKPDDFYEKIANDVDEQFDRSNYDNNTPIGKILSSIGKNKKVFCLFKDEFVGLRVKTYAYLMDDDTEHEKAKETKKCVIKRRLLFEDYTDSLFNDKIILKSQQTFEHDYHNVYTEQINKIALSSDNGRRLQTFDRTITHPYGANAFKACESEILSKYK